MTRTLQRSLIANSIKTNCLCREISSLQVDSTLFAVPPLLLLRLVVFPSFYNCFFANIVKLEREAAGGTEHKPLGHRHSFPPSLIWSLLVVGWKFRSSQAKGLCSQHGMEQWRGNRLFCWAPISQWALRLPGLPAGPSHRRGKRSASQPARATTNANERERVNGTELKKSLFCWLSRTGGCGGGGGATEERVVLIKTTHLTSDHPVRAPILDFSIVVVLLLLWLVYEWLQ